MTRSANFSSRVGATAIVILISGCSVGPDYVTPELEVPAEFHAQQSGNVASATPIDLTRWWETFDDPVLNRLVDEAAASNLDVALAKARVREARALLTLSRSGFFPNPNVEGKYTRSRPSKNARSTSTNVGGSGSDSDLGDAGSGSGSGGSSTSINSPGQTTSLYEVGFDATWEIDIFGGTRREVEAAYDTYEAQIEAKRSAMVTLLAEVAGNYVALRGSQKRFAITERNVAAQKETLDLQHMRLDAGLANDLTVAQAQAQYETTSAQLPSLEVPIYQAIHRLSILLGKDPAALFDELSHTQPLPTSSVKIPAGLPSELLQRRPDIRQAERELAAATANIGVATADLFPKLELTGAIGLRSQISSSLFEGASRYWSAGPSLTWNVLNWFAILANIEVKNARQEQALINYKKVVLGSFEEVENALVSVSREQARRARLRESVIASTKALSLAQDLNKAGIVDFLNVLNAQQSVFDSEDRLVQSEQAATLNIVSLYKALGGGWETMELVPESPS